MNTALSAINSGDTAWVLISTALVLLMTPGLAFFYGGMVQARHVVSTVFQSLIAMSVVGILWAVVGYSLAFSGDIHGWIGNFHFLGLRGVGQEPNADYAATIPHLSFMIFQAMFAVITPALITGAFAERIRFKAWIWISALWSLFVYVPVAHWVWGNGGWIHQLGGLDFAGGLVVHMTAGYAALVAAILFRKRQDFGKSEVRSYDTGMVVLGTSLLWFGWFGFNAGSALAANGIAVQAFVTTFFGGAAAMAAWVWTDYLRKGKPSAIGACVGAVAGLVAITPASGFVTPMAAIAIGGITGWVCNFSVSYLKGHLHLDDTLDVFGCHGIGGTIGTVLTGVFASKSVNSSGANGLLYGNSSLLGIQLISALAVVIFSVVLTFAIIKGVGAFTPIQLTEQEEAEGLDQVEHGEQISSWITHVTEISKVVGSQKGLNASGDVLGSAYANAQSLSLVMEQRENIVTR